MQFCRVPYLCPAGVIVFTAIVSSLASAQTPATGVRAHATSADYAASRQTSRATYAASLVPADQVRHLFAADISKTYLVFEVACYPSQTGAGALDPVALNPNDFLVKAGSTSEFVHPTDASTVAAFLWDKNTPRLRSRGPEVVTTAGVGYESGTDPSTGRRVHGTYTEAGVAVANPGDNFPPPPARPGSSPQDRIALENQLLDKSLPEGNFTAPVAGFLYFAAEPLKKAKGTYNLQYLNDDSGKVDLVLSPKVK